MKKIISAVCVLLMLASMCGCTSTLENAQPDGEVISAGGIAVQQGDWIYFINGAMPINVNAALADSSVAKIYRMKADGSELDAITDKKAHDMYLYKDKIFYTTPTKTEVVLCCIGIGRSDDEELQRCDCGFGNPWQDDDDGDDFRDFNDGRQRADDFNRRYYA